jgi:hypothetical protein
MTLWRMFRAVGRHPDDPGTGRPITRVCSTFRTRTRRNSGIFGAGAPGDTLSIMIAVC